MAMAKQEDENYWTSSVTKGFDFDSEENQVTWLECHVIEIRTIKLDFNPWLLNQLKYCAVQLIV